MRILDRYFIREFLIPLCLCLAAFFLVYIIYDLSAHLDDYIEYKIPIAELAAYYVIQLPMVMVQLIPLSILLAIVYSIGLMSRHSEITAMRAAGISIYRIMKPFLGVGIIFTLLLLYLNEEFAPRAYSKSERLIEEYSHKQEKQQLRSIAFFNPLAERTWMGQWIPGEGTLNNITIRNLHNRQVAEKISAQKASYLDGEWWLFDGAIQEYDARGRIRGKEDTFSKRRFPFNEKPEDFLSSQKDSLSMNYRELSQNMAFYPPNSDIYGRKLVDLHYKIALPFVAITIVLLAVPLAMRASHGGAAGSAGMSIALGISYYAFLMVSLAMGRGGHLPAWFASWLPNLLFSSVGAVLIYRNR
ncbi:MAG: LptF/LptG family permease [Candidatus Aureabacteria bacterium]|nr:LptF/LptG family permease [Candidatus Auribacterota bacterium]